MSTIVKVLAVALVLFSAAAGASWYLQQHLHADSDAPHAGTEPPAKTKAIAGPHAGEPSGKAPLRPPHVPEAEKVSQMATNLQQQSELLKSREQQLTSRQKNLDVILHDIRSEQKALDDLRKTLGEELKLLTEKLGSVEKKSSEIRQQSASLDGQLNELKSSIVAVSENERKQAATSAKLFDAMETEAAARTLQGLVENGKLDAAVKLLSSMKDRQAAQVLEKLSNTSLAGQLVERLLALKTPSKKSP